MKKGFYFWLVAIAGVFAFLIGLALGVNSEVDHFRQVAVDHGAAEWHVDTKGKTSFHWLDCEGKEATP